MAKKKTKKRKSGGRRRRMSGANTADLKQTAMLIAGGIAGAGLATVVNNYAKSALTTAPLWAGGAIAAGLAAGVLTFAPKSPITTGIGVGMAGMGAMFVANETVISIPGLSGMPSGLPNAQPGPGYLKQKVGYRNPPDDRLGRRVGVLSSGNRGMVGKLFSN